MISLLITGTMDQREKYIKNFCTEHHISQFDQIIIEPDETKKTNSLGIERIRSAQEKIYQKPLQSDEKSVIFAAKELTIEAQNALLKILEEPPNATTIILSLDDINSVLSTIISRCKVISLEKKISADKQTYPTIQTIVSATIGDQLTYAQNFGKSREVALDFLLQTITAIRNEMHAAIMKEENNESVVNEQQLLEELNQVYTTISTTNISPRFALEILFLGL